MSDLTAEQEAKIPEYVARWTEQCRREQQPGDKERDIPRAIEGIQEHYRLLNLKQPLVLSYVPSIFEVCVGGAAVAWLVDQHDSRGQALDAIEDAIAGIDASVVNAKRLPNYPGMLEAIREAARTVINTEGIQFGRLTNRERKSASAAIQLDWYHRHAGHMWASLPALKTFEVEVVNNGQADQVDLDRMNAMVKVGESCGWWYPDDQFVLFCHRPTRFKFDAQGRLSSEDGYAVEYENGWGVAMVDGIPVPDKLVLDRDSITYDEIVSQSNTEIRRIMYRLVGFERVMQLGDAKVIDEDIDPLGYPRRLLRAPKQGVLTEDFVTVQLTNSTPEPDGTRKLYYLRVPPTVTTAREAVAWTFRKTADTYKPLVET